jgi:hypothetical protein
MDKVKGWADLPPPQRGEVVGTEMGDKLEEKKDLECWSLSGDGQIQAEAKGEVA